MTTWFMFYQPKPEKAWKLGMASERSRIVKTERPPFTTILDLDNSFETEDSMTAEDLMKVRYRGPFYIDLDSEDPEEVVTQFKKLLKNLQEDYRVDLDQVALYATGGRGFHLIFDAKMFMTKVPERGMTALPLIYREMANKLFVDTLDLNIYSAKKGRMFREKNVERVKDGKPNGRYKVQISTQEALDMTVEMYQELCSTPRHLPPPSAPVYNSELGLIFATSQSTMEAALAKRKNAKGDASILASFGGKVPPSLLSIMNGENLAEDMGFQAMATQLAIAANAMMMTEEDFLAACQGLIERHQGDSQRYGSPAKRRAELRRMFAYMKGNPLYTFSIGGVRKMMAKGTPAPDLDMGSIGVDEAEESEVVDGEEDFSVSQGIRVMPSGIYRKTPEGVVKVSALGLMNPRQLVDLHTGEVHGYEVDVSIDGGPSRPKVIGMDAFLSRNSFMKFALSAGSCNIGLTDAQIGAIADILRVRTMQSNQQVYTVRREGIDIVTTPEGKLDIIWADQYGVESNYGVNYRLTGSMTEDLQFRTDLRNAPDLEDTPEAREFFTKLFQVNKREVVSRVFGFMLSTFLSQAIRHLYNKYPFLQVYGPAGSGKSETVKLFARLHYNNMEPVMSSALDSTKFVFEEMATCSGSIPFILEEFKPREMDKRLLEKAKGILRSNYNGDSIGKGNVNSSTGQSKLTLTRVSNRSPVVTLGEAIIAQTAILDRCIALPVTKEGKKDRRENFVHCQSNRQYLSALGRLCVTNARSITLDGLRKTIEENMELVRQQVGSKADDNDRPLYNVAVLLTGLHFGRHVMKKVFGDTFMEDFDAMRDAVTAGTEELIPKVVSEAAKVLDTMAFLSRYGEEERGTKLLQGEDYVLVPGVAVQLRLKNSFMKYVRHTRSQGGEVLYDTYEAFYNAMSTYPGTLDTHCTESLLKDSATTAVFEFNLQQLTKDNVEQFRA